MTFQPVLWGRQSITGEQIEADGSRLLNFYAVRSVTPEEAKTPTILHGTPGYRHWKSSRRIYGMLWVNSPTYGRHLCMVHDNGWFSCTPEASLQAAGGAAIATVRYTTSPTQYATGHTRMATDGRRVLFVSSLNVWAYDMESSNFVPVLAPTPTDNSATLPDQDWVDVTWIDGYFILLARNGEFYHSLLSEIDFDQLDFSIADSKPDPGIALADHNRQLYVFGSRSVETWYNAGGADFAFQRNLAFVADFGCAVRDTVQKLDIGVFFMTSLGQIATITGHTVGIVSSETVQERIRLSDIGQARAYAYTEQGHRFYSLTLFVDGIAENWTYDANTQLWHERTQTEIFAAAVDETGHTWAGGADPFLIRQSRDYGYTGTPADPTPIYREAVTPILHNRQARVRMASFEIDIPRRLGDDAAVATLHWWEPPDGRDIRGGRNWRPLATQAQRTRPLNGRRIRFNQLGTFRNRNYRVSFETVRQLDVLNAYTDFERYED